MISICLVSSKGPKPYDLAYHYQTSSLTVEEARALPLPSWAIGRTIVELDDDYDLTTLTFNQKR